MIAPRFPFAAAAAAACALGLAATDARADPVAFCLAPGVSPDGYTAPALTAYADGRDCPAPVVLHPCASEGAGHCYWRARARGPSWVALYPSDAAAYGDPVAVPWDGYVSPAG